MMGVLGEELGFFHKTAIAETYGESIYFQLNIDID
jgi:hypothetical protein